MIQTERDGTPKSDRSRQKSVRHYEGVVAVITLLVVWEMAASHLPPILFPSLGEVGQRFMQLLREGNLINTSLQTYARIFGAVLFSFVVCSALGIWAGLTGRVDRFLSPLIQIKQGVPSLCWIIFSILWFRDVEVRNLFIVFISTMPSLYFLARDGVRAIPSDLWHMVRAWRPNRFQIVTKLLLPATVPQLITGLRVNIGTGARVVVFAELLGGVSGVGYQLRLAEEQFMMSDVMAWTLVLVAWVLMSDVLLKFAEARVMSERGTRGVDE